VPVDDDVLTSTTPAPDADAPVAGRRHGFWLVAGSIGLVCVFVVIEIFANFGVKDSIAHAEYSLRKAETAIGGVRDAGGDTVTPTHMATVEPTLLWVGGDRPSAGLDEISLATDGLAWGAAVQVKPGACFYLHHTASDEVFYGAGTLCTGDEALRATDPRW
jgi:hypothetical protein